MCKPGRSPLSGLRTTTVARARQHLAFFNSKLHSLDFTCLRLWQIAPSLRDISFSSSTQYDEAHCALQTLGMFTPGKVTHSAEGLRRKVWAWTYHFWRETVACWSQLQWEQSYLNFFPFSSSAPPFRQRKSCCFYTNSWPHYMYTCLCTDRKFAFVTLRDTERMSKFLPVLEAAGIAYFGYGLSKCSQAVQHFRFASQMSENCRFEESVQC